VWVVFSHINGVEADAPKYVCLYLDTIGKQLDAFSSAGAVAYLQDLAVKQSRKYATRARVTLPSTPPLR
jgi:hypothetical protein